MMLHGFILLHCRLSFRYLDYIQIKMDPLIVCISPVFLNIKEEIVQKHVNRAHVYTDKQNSLMVISVSEPVLSSNLQEVMACFNVFTL